MLAIALSKAGFVNGILIDFINIAKTLCIARFYEK